MWRDVDSRWGVGIILTLATIVLSNAAQPPRPFTPVKASSKEFRCLNRKTELGGLLLPAQSTAAAGQLLAGNRTGPVQAPIVTALTCRLAPGYENIARCFSSAICSERNKGLISNSISKS